MSQTKRFIDNPKQKGYTLKEEHKSKLKKAIEKRRQKMIGHEVSQETRNKIGLAHKGKKLSEEHKLIAIKNFNRIPWNKGKTKQDGIYSEDKTLGIRY